MDKSVLEALRKDEEFVLYRSKRANFGSPSVLLLVPASTQTAPGTLKKMEHQYSHALKDCLRLRLAFCIRRQIGKVFSWKLHTGQGEEQEVAIGDVDVDFAHRAHSCPRWPAVFVGRQLAKADLGACRSPQSHRDTRSSDYWHSALAQLTTKHNAYFAFCSSRLAVILPVM